MRQLSSKSGFTLIEIIISIIVGGIVAIIVAPILMQGFNAFFATVGSTDMDGQGKLAMERMARDIREIASPATNIDSSSNANLFRFSSDGNTIRYQRDTDNQLIIRETRSFYTWNSTTLCGMVSALTFTYLDENLSPITSDIPADVRVIQIQFTLNYTGAGFNANRTFQTSVFLRNAV